MLFPWVIEFGPRKRALPDHVIDNAQHHQTSASQHFMSKVEILQVASYSEWDEKPLDAA